MTDSSSGPQASTTVAKAAALLTLLAENPDGLGITDLTRRLHTQRAPLYRILEALMRAQLVRRDEAKRYLLGIGTVRLARAYSSQFPAGTEQILAALADEVGVTASLVSVEDDVVTTVVSMTPSTSTEHVFTPPGFRHPEGPLATRIAVQAMRPSSPDDTDAVIEARRRGFAVAGGLVSPVRYVAAAGVPGSEVSGATLVVALVSLYEFDADAAKDTLLHTAQMLAMPFQGRSRR